MEYKKRGGTANFGGEYETNITAWHAIRLALDDGIDDVLMASNVGDYGDFDDIVLRICYKNGTDELRAIQLKHKLNTQLRISFVNKKKKYSFSLKRYKDSYLKKISTKLLERKDHLSKDLRPEDIVLCLFTNANMCENTSNILLDRRTSLSCTATPRKSSADFTNTSSDEYHTFEMHREPPDFVRFLCSYLFWCNQNSYEDTVKIITAKIGEEIDPSVVKRICKNFKNELKTKLKCNEKLNFSDALTRSADVVKKSFVKLDLQLLEKTLADISECFRKEYDSALTTYNELPSQSEEYTRFFGRFRFYSNQLDNAEVIEAITLRIKKSFGEVQADVTRKFLDYIRSYALGNLLLTKQQIKSKLLELILPSGQDVQRKMEIFRNVTDLSDPEQRLEVLAHLEVCIQGKKNVRLVDVVDASFCHDHTPEFLFRNAGETIRVGTKLKQICENYIRRKFFKVLLEQEILWRTNDYIYILDGRLERGVMNRLEVIDLTNGGQELPKQSTKKNYVVLISKDDDVDGHARKLAQIKPNRVHYLKVSGCYLEWEKSWGSTAELNQFVVKGETVEEDELLRYFGRTINVISAVSGMGKSTILDALARYSPSDRWVLRINLNEYNKDLCDRLRDVLSDPLEYFYEKIEPPDDFSRRVFRTLKSRKAITVLIDAFDEISPRYTSGVLELIAKLDQLGVYTWITTRPNAELYIQERLHLMPVDIQGISEDDVAQFLGTQGLSRLHLPMNLIDFCKIPLHLNMLTTISSRQELRWEDLQETDLYDHFIVTKCSIYYEKFGIDLKRNHVSNMVVEVDELIRTHQVLALLLIYDDQFLVEHGITSPGETEKLVQDILECKNHLGLVTTVIDEVPIFSHRAYGEYLAAKWLSSNLDHAAFKLMYEDLFNLVHFILGCDEVRLMFDKLTTRTHPLHAAVVNENLELVRQICSQESVPMVRDQLNRTPLHLCASHFNIFCDVEHASNRVICQIMDEIVRSSSSKSDFQELDVLGWDWEEYASMTGNSKLFYIACYWGCKHILLQLPAKRIESIECTNSDYKDDPIKYVVSDGQVDLLDLLLERGIYTNIENLALCAVEYRQADVLKKLIERGVKLEGNQRVWVKYLETAFVHRVSAFVDMLGTVVDVDAISKDGISAMHFAAKLGLVEYLEVLTSKGAHVDIADRWNKTPLGVALEYKQTECVNFLNAFRKKLIQTCDDDFESCEERLGLASIRHILGDAERKDVTRRMLLTGCTPLRAASLAGHLNALKEMVNLFGSANALSGDDSSTLLQWAVRGRHLDVAEWLVGAGADVNYADECGFTMLHVALANFTLWKDGVGDFGLEMLKLLVSKGADVHVNRKDQDTYLNVAIKLGSFEAVRFLLDCGVDPNAASKCTGNVPLLLAVLWNYLSKLFRRFGSYEEFMIDFWDIRLAASFWSKAEYFLRILPCYGSAFTGNLNTVRQLIGKGADVNVTSVNMNTPLFYAVSSGDLDFAKLLVENGADAVRENVYRQSCFGMAVGRKRWEMVQLFVDNGIPADHRDSGEEYTALNKAIVTKCYDVMKYLLGKGANVNTKVGKQTYMDLILERLMYYKRDWKAIKILIENGADVNSKGNSEGNTPLHCAVEEDRQDIVEYLVGKGADATIRNGFNKPLTALELARELKRTHMESYLK